MKNRYLLISLALTSTLSCGLAQAQQATLRVFTGGSNQRPDLMRQLFDKYQSITPGVKVKVEVETGGSTSELQRQYLSTVLNAKDSTLDIYIIDIVNPAQYFTAGWLEPLDAYIGGPEVLKPYLPAYAHSNVVKGKVVAMPAFADAMFMYYRKDLLEKYGIAEPKTWDELSAAALKIKAGEKDPNLQGLSLQGAPIEGAVCTFMLPYWSAGKSFSDANGQLTLDKTTAAKGMNMWLKLVDDGVVKKNVAEVKTPDTVNEFKAGQVVFGISWGFAWNSFQENADSKVKGKVGVMPLPAVAGGKSATCLGGWQWAVSAFSKNKAEAANLVKFISSPEASKFLAAEGALLPTYESVYTDPEVLKNAPWFKDAATVVSSAQSRPVTPRYGEVSDVLRTTTSAILARTKTAEEGVADIEGRLKRVMR